jgi:ribonuclease E
MANKMLIDATHPEETRVVVVRGNRVEEFDFESASRRQLRGNIYLAKVTRVEPSLQAAFVDYGGNRHGFLAFSEIHPDYYQIPVADRQALIAEEERAHRAADAEIDRRAGRRRGGQERSAAVARDAVRSAPVEEAPEPVDEGAAEHGGAEAGPAAELEITAAAAGESEASLQPAGMEAQPAAETADGEDEADASEHEAIPAEDTTPEAAPPGDAGDADNRRSRSRNGGSGGEDEGGEDGAAEPEEVEEEEVVESVGGGDAMEDVPERMPRLRRQYKIQEVIKRRQIMLVQVVKEERGTKGAALTTYLSLAGRYSVLMPNTARGGGISRKITSAQDRKRLKTIAQDLEVPEGMGVILRTAGANRTKAEVKRDFEYLIRLWETVRDLTLNSTAPTLVYEEGSLIKRSIRDLYNKDIDEVLVAGDDAYREAKEFMRMLMPSHAKNVKPYKDPQPLFTRYGVESQLDAMFSPTVQLRSGGYIVVNQTEALVAIDVNSGRATREHHIEDTALKTNLEAAEEVARQLRLRDLAGLIVIDFIDMDETRNNRSVERRLKECLKHDRARIQVGRISHFGLLEMSRQRIRTGVLESSTEKCPHCGGTGHMRSVSSVALHLLRSLEEMLIKGATHNLVARSRGEVAIYVLNHKRAHLRELEERFRVSITVNADPTFGGQQSFVIDRGEQVHSLEAAKALVVQPMTVVPDLEEEDVEAATEDEEAEGEETEEADAAAQPRGEGEAAPRAEEDRADANGRRRRRRRRRRGEGSKQPFETPAAEGLPPQDAAEAEAEVAPEEEDEGESEGAGLREGAGESEAELERRRRRRGRRGGRRRRGREGEAQSFGETALAETPPESEPAPGPGAPEIAPAMTAAEDSASAAPTEATPELPEPAATVPVATAQPSPAEPAPAAQPAPPAEQPEPTRRRSTVREPVFAGEAGMASPPAAAAPAPEPSAPAAPEPAAESETQPRRTGWWSRRFGGG